MRDVLITGFSKSRAQLLAMALDQARSQTFSFTIVEGTLDSLDSDRLEKQIVVALADNDRQTSIKAAQALRTERFFWEPIHILMRRLPPLSSFPQEWAVYFHPTPPEAEKLAAMLLESESVTARRREEIVHSALVSLAEDLDSLSRSLSRKHVIQPERLRNAMANALKAVAEPAGGFATLQSCLKHSLALPGAEQGAIKELLPLVIEAETSARESGDDPHLVASLHTLNNVLRLAAWQPPDSGKLSTKISAKMEKFSLSELSSVDQGGFEGLCGELRQLLKGLDSENEQAREKLDLILARLNSRLLPKVIPTDSTTRNATTRIVVAEDEPDWRRLIVNVLESVTGGSVEIQEATTVVEAEELLMDPRPALALIDLGLPKTADTGPLLESGLLLIKRFSASDNRGRRFLHRFIVLTAAENYSQAVREALDYGVAPRNYLQKNPLSWESELRAQVRLALQPPHQQQPRIEVFKRTTRIARVEGLEIKLDYPQWCVLATLAASRKGLWCEPERLARILYWNYEVRPDARSQEAEQLDPEQRILNQLPHYTSDLNQRIAETYLHARHEPLPVNAISYDREIGYRLNARATVLDQVDEHAWSWRTPRVLVVEDSPEWGTQIVDELSRHGFEVQLARWTDEAMQMIEAGEPDLISLDLELPSSREEYEAKQASSQSAVEFVQLLRDNRIDCPVAILTAVPWQDRTMLELLRKGVRVDDYLSKHVDQPILRLTNSLARLWQESLANTRILDWDPMSPLHAISIDRQQGRLTDVAGFRVDPAGDGLTILKVLSATPNMFVSRAELLEVIYGSDDNPPENPDKALNSHIKRLRKTITDATGGNIPGDQIICGDRGIYWLRGIVRQSDD